MQKKIIALAIAGLASTAAFAQTNVTIYGVADATFDSVKATGSSDGSAADFKNQPFCHQFRNTVLVFCDNIFNKIIKPFFGYTNPDILTVQIQCYRIANRCII